MKGETNLQFARFQEYLKIPPYKRTLEELKKRLNTQESTKTNTKPTTMDALKHASSEWCWIERAKLYDMEKAIQDEEESEQEYKETNKKVKERLLDMLDFTDELFHKVKDNDNNYALMTIMKLFNENTVIIERLYTLYRLACGRSTTNNFNDNKVSGKVAMKLVGEENIHELSDEDLDLILSANDDNPDEDFTDRL